MVSPTNNGSPTMLQFSATAIAFVTIAITSSQLCRAQDQEAKALPQAHAHNDYYHERPLLDALDNGFCSVEADIFLVDDQLLVAHSRFELRQEKTLEALYLQPLRERVLANSGRVHPGGPTFTLLVDIKTDGSAVYERLRQLLNEYRDIISGFEDGTYRERAIQIVISGDRPFAEIESDVSRLVGIDGRLTDLDTEKPSHLIPLISDRWSSHFRWRGEGAFPADEREKLHQIVEKAHADGRRVRFWATPENPIVWKELLDAGVDHINSDRLTELREFLESQSMAQD